MMKFPNNLENLEKLSNTWSVQVINKKNRKYIRK